MRRSWWMAFALAAVSVGGCSSGKQVKDDEIKLGRVPLEDKREVFAAEHNISVAQANQAAAERSRDEARSFKSLADQELDVARAQVGAAKKGMDLAQKTRDAAALRDAEGRMAQAQRQVAAAEARKEYAARLEELRDEELSLAGQKLAAARAGAAAARIEALQRRGITPSQGEAGVIETREAANAAVTQQERKVASLRDEVEGRKSEWERQRRSSDTASRSAPGLPEAPRPRDTIEAAPMPMPESNDANSYPRRQ